MADTAARTAQETKEVTADAAGQAKEVAQTAQQQVAAVAGEARQQVTEMASEAKAQAKNIVEDTRTQLQGQAQAQTEKLAASLQRVNSELRALCEGQPEQADTARQYLQQASSKLEHIASHVESRGFEGLIEDMQRFARRRPGTFLLGAAVAGFAAGRLLRSAKDEQNEHYETQTGIPGSSPYWEMAAVPSDPSSLPIGPTPEINPRQEVS